MNDRKRGDERRTRAARRELAAAVDMDRGYFPRAGDYGLARMRTAVSRETCADVRHLLRRCRNQSCFRGPLIVLLVATVALPVKSLACVQRDTHWRSEQVAAIPRGALRLRGGAFGSTRRTAIGLSSAELAALRELRSALGTQLKAAVKQNPDLGSDDRLARLLRANSLDVPRTVKFWARMQEWRAHLMIDRIRHEVSPGACSACLPHRAQFKFRRGGGAPRCMMC